MERGAESDLTVGQSCGKGLGCAETHHAQARLRRAREVQVRLDRCLKLP
jgi:hypothetical protein